MATIRKNVTIEKELYDLIKKRGKLSGINSFSGSIAFFAVEGMKSIHNKGYSETNLFENTEKKGVKRVKNV